MQMIRRRSTDLAAATAVTGDELRNESDVESARAAMHHSSMWAIRISIATRARIRLPS